MSTLLDLNFCKLAAEGGMAKSGHELRFRDAKFGKFVDEVFGAVPLHVNFIFDNAEVDKNAVNPLLAVPANSHHQIIIRCRVANSNRLIEIVAFREFEVAIEHGANSVAVGF